MQKIAIFLLLLFVFLTVLPQKVLAVDCSIPLGTEGIGVSVPSNNPHTIKVNLIDYQDKGTIRLQSAVSRGVTLSPEFEVGVNGTFDIGFGGIITVSGSTVTWVIPTSVLSVQETFKTATVSISGICTIGSYNITTPTVPGENQSCEINVWQNRGGEKCSVAGCTVGGGVTTYIKASNLKEENGDPLRKSVTFDIAKNGPAGYINFAKAPNNGVVIGDFETKGPGTYTITLRLAGTRTVLCPEVKFTAIDSCEGICSENTNIYESSSQSNFELCEQVTEEDKQTCLTCVGNNSIWTAVGCVPTDPQGIISTFINLALSIGGGVTLLLILAGAFRLSVSAGDPKQAEEAKEQITSAVIGLLFIIFSITMLRFIGVQFLQIPGFGGS